MQVVLLPDVVLQHAGMVGYLVTEAPEVATGA